MCGAYFVMAFKYTVKGLGGDIIADLFSYYVLGNSEVWLLTASSWSVLYAGE